MSDLVRLSPADFDAAAELAELATANLLDSLPEHLQLGPVSLQPICYEAATAGLRAANQLGIEAGWELHLGHTVLSLSPNEDMPKPSDPILCITWGQFLPQHTRDELDITGGVEPYFGKRNDIRPILGGGELRRRYYYGRFYSPASFVMRGVIDPEHPDDSEYNTPILFGRHLNTKSRLLDYYAAPPL